MVYKFKKTHNYLIKNKKKQGNIKVIKYAWNISAFYV